MLALAMVLSEGLAARVDDGCRKSDQHPQHVTVACRQSFRDPLTQTPYIHLDSNLFLLDSGVSHETAPHLAMRLLVDSFSRPRLSLMNIMSAEENHSLAYVRPREQLPISSALDFFVSD